MLVDLAGDGQPLPTPDRLDGHSMKRLLEAGVDASWPDVAIADFNAGGAPGPIRMVRHGRYKYVHLEGHPALLFDLVVDPDELTNIAGQTGTVAVEAELRKLALNNYHPAAIREQVMASQKRRLFIKGVDEQSPLAGNWAHEARPGDAQRFVRGGGLAGGEHATKARARFPFVEAARENPV